MSIPTDTRGGTDSQEVSFQKAGILARWRAGVYLGKILPQQNAVECTEGGRTMSEIYKTIAEGYEQLAAAFRSLASAEDQQNKEVATVATPVAVQ